MTNILAVRHIDSEFRPFGNPSRESQTAQIGIIQVKHSLRITGPRAGPVFLWGNCDKCRGASPYPSVNGSLKFAAERVVLEHATCVSRLWTRATRTDHPNSQSLAENLEPGFDPLAIHTEVAFPVNRATVDGECGL